MVAVLVRQARRASARCLEEVAGVEHHDNMLGGGEAEQFDMAFIDADKENILSYYDRCLSLTKLGGLLLIVILLVGTVLAALTYRALSRKRAAG